MSFLKGLAFVVIACHFEDKFLNSGECGEDLSVGIKSGAIKRIFVATPALRQMMIKREPLMSLTSIWCLS